MDIVADASAGAAVSMADRCAQGVAGQVGLIPVLFGAAATIHAYSIQSVLALLLLFSSNNHKQFCQTYSNAQHSCTDGDHCKLQCFNAAAVLVCSAQQSLGWCWHHFPFTCSTIVPHCCTVSFDFAWSTQPPPPPPTHPLGSPPLLPPPSGTAVSDLPLVICRTSCCHMSWTT